jgi:hypothetical protein
MQYSYSELIKLLLSEIIVEYFELNSYKRKKITLPKKVNSVPKEYRQARLSSKWFSDEITV